MSQLLAIDLDHTITGNPEFFRGLCESWVRNGNRVNIVTARNEQDASVSLRQLYDMGFVEVITSEGFAIHCYPITYAYPYTSPEAQAFWSAQHAAWKARICTALGAVALFDDGQDNIDKCREKGIYAIQVPWQPAVV